MLQSFPPLEPGTGNGPGRRSVKITVHKLQEPSAQPPLSQHQQLSSGTETQQRPMSRQKPNSVPPMRPVVHSQSYRRTLGKHELTKENRQSSATEFRPNGESSAERYGNQQRGGELLTSHFAAGGRGVVLAALKQRSTQRGAVNVPLLDPGPLQHGLKGSPGKETGSQNAPGTRTSTQEDPSPRTSSQDALGPRNSSQDALGPRNSSQDALGPRNSSQDVVHVAGIQMRAGLSYDFPRGDNNAAAAALKAQVDDRVSRLTDSIHKQLQADSDRVWSLSQQTLHHMQTHSQQMQLQSQLLESALSIVKDHTHRNPVTSDPAVMPDLRTSGDPASLLITHLDTSANVLGNQQPSSSATTRVTGPVTMATPHSDRWLEQNRKDHYGQDDSSVSTVTQPAAGSHLPSSAYHNQEVAKRANEMLREMGRLKTEMEMLMTQPEDSQKATRTGPDNHQPQHKLLQSQRPHPYEIQSQQNLSQPKNFHTSCQKSKTLQTEPHRSNLDQSHSKAQQGQPQQNHSQSCQSPIQQVQSQQKQRSQNHSNKSHSMQVQRRSKVPSVLEEASLVLRQVQREKKVLEENLEAQLRTKSGEILHCQLEALASNKDWNNTVRIKRTVDAWIKTLTKDIEAEMSAKDTATTHSSNGDVALTSQQKVAGQSAPTRKGRPASMLRGTGNKTAAGRGSKRQTALPRPGVEHVRPTGRLTDSEQAEVDAELYLSHLYGRAPYEGVRRTVKKSPYLRFSSPGSPLNRKPRPQLTDSVKGVKMKSTKTQTYLAPPLNLQLDPPQHHYIINSSHLTNDDPADPTETPADSYFTLMAIPLGLRRMESSSRCLPEHEQRVSSPQTASPTSSIVAEYNGASVLQIHKVDQQDPGEVPPPVPRVNIIEGKSEEEEDKENIFPGTDFLSVADVNQEEEEVVSAVTEEALELDGVSSPPPVLYQGPVFPPQARSALPAQDQSSTLLLNQQRDALENRLVEWVEQQLMARMISEIYRPSPPDPAQNHFADQSESEEKSVTSDIVEAAGGGVLQLFVDTNMSVDSSLIRQLVDEVLTEHVALMLGHRDTVEAAPESGQKQPGGHQDVEFELHPTPVPTPPPTTTQQNGGTPLLTTPPPSEPTSLIEESPQPITAPADIATPTASPEPVHSAESPQRSPSPLTGRDSELPLAEEKTEEHLDTDTPLLLMSVAEDKIHLLSPPPFIPLAPSQSPPPDLEARPSSSSSTTDTCSSSSSSSVVTSDLASKHISEGELLGVNQMSAMTEEEEGIYNFSNSLQELQEVDFDPPSEGQVRGHDILLTLLNKMETWDEEGVSHRHSGERPQPEGSFGRDQRMEDEEVSLGEVGGDWTTEPFRTTKPKNKCAAASCQGHTSSSRVQISQCADMSLKICNQGSGSVDNHMVEPICAPTSDLQSHISLSPPAPPPHPEDTQASGQVFPVLAGLYEPHTAGTRKVDVHLPSIRPEEEVNEYVMVESAPDTDSSSSDVF